MEAGKSTNQKNSNRLSLLDIVKIGMRYWKLFVCLIVVFTVYALYKYKSTEPLYSRTASILIKEETASTLGSFSEMFSSFGGVNFSSDANNELEAIKSPAIMLEVIENLDLSYDFKTKKFLTPITLYGNARPFVFTLEDAEYINDRTFDFEGELSPDGIYTISKIIVSKGGKKEKHQVDYKFDIKKTTRIEDPNTGPIVVSPKPEVAPAPQAKLASAPVDPKTIKLDIQWFPPLYLVPKYTGELKISIPNRHASVIEIVCTDNSIQRADDIINEIIKVYNQHWIDDKNALTIATEEFVSERLKIIEQELSEVDAEISTFKSNHKMPDVGLMVTSEMTKLATLDQQILTLTSQLEVAKNILEYTRDPALASEFMPAIGGTLEDPTLNTEITEYNKIMMERNKLQSASSRNNPLVIDYDDRLARLRTSLSATVSAKITALNTTIAELKGDQRDALAKIAESPRQANDLLSNERQQKVKEALYLYLLERREENSMSQAFTAYNIRLLSPPMGSGAPVAPKLIRDLIIWLGFALILFVIIVFLLEQFDNSVKTHKDVDDALSVPYLGGIPDVSPKRSLIARMLRKEPERVSQIVVQKGNDNPVNEAFRILRSNLERMISLTREPDSNKGIVIMITSAIPSSGKTFVSLNLSVAFALKGKKVLLLDADLRKGSISKSLNISQNGVSKYLCNVCNLDDVTLHNYNGIENFDVIPCGVLPPDPAELLDSDRFGALIEELRSKYDIIIVDCPPSEAVTDVDIISKYADRAIYVIRRNRMRRDFLPVIQKFYTNRRFNNMTYIFNGIDFKHGAFGYGYGYGNKKAK